MIKDTQTKDYKIYLSSFSRIKVKTLIINRHDKKLSSDYFPSNLANNVTVRNEIL